MSVEEYIENCPEERRLAMNELREMILRAFPLMAETTQYKMPTYSLDGEIVFAFASQKHYMAFYVCHHDLLDQLSDVTDKYDCGKSCIRFRKWDSKVKEDLEKISTYVCKNIAASRFNGKYKAK